MKRRPVSPPVWRQLTPFRAKIALVELETADLGKWQVYEWELWEGKEFVAKGSYPYGNNYITVEDVLGQLEYEYLDKPNLVTAPDIRDEAYGL
jgi:hypothetical protein